MPKKSITNLQTGDPRQYIANLFVVLSKLAPAQLRLLYGDLFTENEADMLAKRLEIARGLLTGKSYLQIQKQLGVTANTVAQIQKVLKNAGVGFREAVKFLTSVEESKFVVRPLVNKIQEPGSQQVSHQADEKTFKTVFKKIFHSGI